MVSKFQSKKHAILGIQCVQNPRQDCHDYSLQVTSKKHTGVLLPTLEPYTKVTETQLIVGCKELSPVVLALQHRRERCIILMMLKILHNVEPNCCDIKFKVSPRHGDVAIIPSLPN